MNIGLIINDNKVIGTFKHFTAEDCFGKREMKNISIQSKYFNFEFYLQKLTHKSSDKLKFIYAEVLDPSNNEYKLLDDLGYGSLLPFDAFISNDITTIQLAVWTKEP